MANRRQEQVNGFLREEISEIIQRELKDPRLGFASITSVEVSPDLRHAKVFISVLGSAEEQQETIAGLTSAAGFIRHLLKPRMHTRHIPELTFTLDRSMAYAESIAKTLNEIHDELHPAPGETSSKEDSTE